MSSRRLPNSVVTFNRAFAAAKDMWGRTAPADRALTAEQGAQLDLTVPTSLYSRWRKEADEVETALGRQTPLTSAAAQALDRLAMLCSHYHQSLDMAIARGKYTPGVRVFYGRNDNDTTIPDLSSSILIEEAAEHILTGDAKQAVEGAAGVAQYGAAVYGSGAVYGSLAGTTPFVPMANPSAVEVGEILTVCRTLRGQAKDAAVVTDKEREDLQALYNEARAFLIDLADTVEFYYRKDTDDSSRRQKCERWGVVYVSDTEPLPVTPPPTTPTQPTTPNP